MPWASDGNTSMLRTGDDYRQSIRDGREVWIDGERVKDVTRHPAFKPIIDVKARMYDMAHEERYIGALTYVDGNERHSIFYRPPKERKDWADKITAVDHFIKDIG